MTLPPEAVSPRPSVLAGRHIPPEPMMIGSTVVPMRDGSALQIPSPRYATP